MVDKKQISILLVEDHQITRLGLKVMLEECADFELVGEADNGHIAVSQTNALRPRVVLMDIGLPGMNGIEAARQIKTIMPETRIIILTTHDHDDDVFAALSAGADGYCLKDSSSETIAMAVRAVNNGVCWLDPGIAKKVLAAVEAPLVEKPLLEEKYDTTNKFGLSPRELEVLELLIEGLSNLQMAEKLVVGSETIKTHMRHIMEKLVVADRTQAAVKALREGLLSPRQDPS